MTIMNTLNYKKKKKNSNIYLINVQLGNKYANYSGVLIENLEDKNEQSNSIYGYMYNPKQEEEYIIYGSKFINKDMMQVILMNKSNNYATMVLNFEKIDGLYVTKDYQNYIFDKFDNTEYDRKKFDKTKRKVLNYFYDL